MISNKYQKNSQEELFPEMIGPNYIGFLDEIQNHFPVIRNKRGYDTEAKDKAIKKYFPGLYRKNDVFNWSPKKKGALFLKLVKSAKLQIEKTNKKKELLEQII